MSSTEEGVPGERQVHEVLARTRSPRAIEALEQASAEARKKGAVLEETAAQEQVVQHLQRDIDAVQREIETATPRASTMLRQSQLRDALARELALEQRISRLREELLDAQTELQGAKRQSASLRQELEEQLWQQQEHAAAAATAAAGEDGHGNDKEDGQNEATAGPSQRQPDQGEGEEEGSDETGTSDEGHRAEGTEQGTPDRGGSEIDSEKCVDQTSSSENSSTSESAESDVESDASDSSDETDDERGPPPTAFSVYLQEKRDVYLHGTTDVRSTVRRVRLEISMRGISVKGYSEGQRVGPEEFCYRWPQVRNWTPSATGKVSDGIGCYAFLLCLPYMHLHNSWLSCKLFGYVVCADIQFKITDVGVYLFRTKRSKEIIEAVMKQINYILAKQKAAVQKADPVIAARDRAVRQLMLLGVPQRTAAATVEATLGNFRAAAEALDFELQVAPYVGSPIGLPNRSNDCFWLATLQCLRHLPGFAHTVTASMECALQRPPVNVAHALANLLLRMEREEYADHLSSRCPELSEFIQICAKNLPKDFDGHALVHSNYRRQAQEDSNEFLNQLLNALTGLAFQGGEDTGELGCQLARSASSSAEDDRKRLRLCAIEKELTEHSKDENWAEVYQLVTEFADIQWDISRQRLRSGVGELLEGQRLVVMECSACKRWSAGSADPFLMEEVRVQPARAWRASSGISNSLSSMLRNNTARDSPEGYRCDGCGKADTTAFRDGLRKLPRVYAVHINRTLPNGSRCSEPVDFKDSLDLRDMLIYKQQGPIDHRSRPCASTYQLAAVTFHSGLTARSGHYLACVRDLSLGASPIFVVTKRLKVTKDANPSSKEIMQVEPGTVLRCLEQRELSTGLVRRNVTRMLCQYGWVTYSDASLDQASGWTVLDDDEVNECGPGETPQRFERSRAGVRAAMLFYVRDDSDEPDAEPDAEPEPEAQTEPANS